MKKQLEKLPLIMFFAIALAALLLAACGKGLSKEQQAEVDATVADYTARIADITWWEAQYHETYYAFYSDGRVEEDGRVSEPGNWVIRFGGEYDGSKDVSKMSQKEIEEQCDYYIHFDAPVGSAGFSRLHLKVTFDDSGNLVLGSIDPMIYEPGPAIVREVPDGTTPDPYFYGNFTSNNWGVWGFEDGGSIGKIWVFQDDGTGAETIGSMNGELIYPDYFYWSFKDGQLYIEWARDDEYVAEYGKDIDVYHVEKGDGEFFITHYLDFNGTGREHLVITDKLDIYSW